jgi:hypothetical protein
MFGFWLADNGLGVKMCVLKKKRGALKNTVKGGKQRKNYE